MSAASSWFVSILFLLGLVFALHAAGVDAGSALGVALRGVDRALLQPL